MAFFALVFVSWEVTLVGDQVVAPGVFQEVALGVTFWVGLLEDHPSVGEV